MKWPSGHCPDYKNVRETRIILFIFGKNKFFIMNEGRCPRIQVEIIKKKGDGPRLIDYFIYRMTSSELVIK